MRVETTIISDQHMVETSCPICEQADSDYTESMMAYEKKLQYFDAWLAMHGLNRDMLESHYHLKADHFFDDIK